MSEITGTITSMVVIGYSKYGDGVTYSSPLTITKTGVVAADGRGVNSIGVWLPSGEPGTATIVNQGNITGASEAPGSGFYFGGPGVQLDSTATLTNSGTIAGGKGYFDLGSLLYRVGGPGVIQNAPNVLINNTGLIVGGGVFYQAANFTAGGGGDGLYLLGTGKVMNSGTILGATGGSTYRYQFANNGIGGYGVCEGYTGNETITNSGLIEGGTGGTSSHYFGNGSNGGDGLYLQNSYVTLTNSGRIVGGAGGGYSGGPQGGAITGHGGNGADGVHDRYQAGYLTNTGTITGGVGGYGVDSNGNGGSGFVSNYIGTVVASSVVASIGSNSGVITGGRGGSSNGAEGGSGGAGVSLSKVSFRNTGKITGGAGGSSGRYDGGNGGIGASLQGGTLITSGTITGGAAGANYPGAATAPAVYLTVAPYYHNKVLYLTPSTLVVDPGAVFKGAVISENYFVPSLIKSSGGKDNVLEVAGTSTKALSGVGTSFTGFTDISFASGAAWTIQGNGAGLTSGQEIYGFTAGDTIDVSSLHFNAKDKVSVATAGTVSITQGATVTKIDIVGATKGESDFHVSKDKSGGTDLTRGTQPKMNFLGSTISNAGAVPVDKTLPPLEHAGGWMGVGTDGRNHVSVGIDLRPYGAVPGVMTPSVPFDGLFVPVTVQAG